MTAALGGWLAGLGVTRAAMEATSECWRAPFYLLEDRFETGWSTLMTSSIYPAGRRPTDWTRCGWARSPNGRCSRPSFVPLPAIRALGAQ